MLTRTATEEQIDARTHESITNLSTELDQGLHIK